MREATTKMMTRRIVEEERQSRQDPPRRHPKGVGAIAAQPAPSKNPPIKSCRFLVCSPKVLQSPYVAELPWKADSIGRIFLRVVNPTARAAREAKILLTSTDGCAGPV
jgi:hypothetical protein